MTADEGGKAMGPRDFCRLCTVAVALPSLGYCPQPAALSGADADIYLCDSLQLQDLAIDVIEVRQFSNARFRSAVIVGVKCDSETLLDVC